MTLNLSCPVLDLNTRPIWFISIFFIANNSALDTLGVDNIYCEINELVDLPLALTSWV